MDRYKEQSKAEKLARELGYLMVVINNRMNQLTSDDWALMSTDPELWITASMQLKEASKLALQISRKLQ